MELIKETRNYDFIGKRYILIPVSLLMMAFSVYLWFASGDAKWGVDFRGGTELVVSFNEDVKIEKVREEFEKGGFGEVIVQAFQNNERDFTIRLSQSDSQADTKEKVKRTLEASHPAGYKIIKEDFVGPTIGEQIRRDAVIAVILAVIGILAYLWFRFELRYGLGAVAALVHDVVIVIGADLLTGRQMNASILAALLTVVGFSVNDTIVIFDRVRENLELSRKARAGKKGESMKAASLAEIMNLSVNETLYRTIITSLTVFFVVVPLWLFGGGAVSDLAFSLVIGVIAGCYSTIYMACPVVLAFERSEPPRTSTASGASKEAAAAL